jgi:hypothetical protein
MGSDRVLQPCVERRAAAHAQARAQRQEKATKAAP